MRNTILFSTVIILSAVTLALAEAGDGLWISKVPEGQRARVNPVVADTQAPQVGAKLFQQHCASCHGEDGQGKGKRPSMHTERIKSATAGELEWLLTNGSLRNGMPSWSRLPEEQRWQIVSYLKSRP